MRPLYGGCWNCSAKSSKTVGVGSFDLGLSNMGKANTIARMFLYDGPSSSSTVRMANADVNRTFLSIPICSPENTPSPIPVSTTICTPSSSHARNRSRPPCMSDLVGVGLPVIDLVH